MCRSTEAVISGSSRPLVYASSRSEVSRVSNGQFIASPLRHTRLRHMRQPGAQRFVGPEQPRRKLRRRLIGAARAVYTQEHLLRQFLGNRVILHHPEEEMYYGQAVLLQKHAETRSISFLDPEHQLCVKVQSRRGSPHIW